jgi:hypothetical protein
VTIPHAGAVQSERQVAAPTSGLRDDSWRQDLLLTRQARTVHGVLPGAFRAAQVGSLVQPVRSRRAE